MDLKQVAQTTAGFTGADLENLLNESNHDILQHSALGVKHLIALWKRHCIARSTESRRYAILAAKENRAFIKQGDIKQAFIKVGIGSEKKSRII